MNLKELRSKRYRGTPLHGRVHHYFFHFYDTTTMAAKKSNNDVETGESTPLLDSSQYSPDNEPPPLKEMKEHSFKERTVAGASAVAFSTSIAAMCLESNPSVYVSGVVGAAVAPYATIQQEKITQCEALEQTNERLESEVQQLQHENERLSTQVNQLESSVLQYVLYNNIT
jgi:hypothetical protein